MASNRDISFSFSLTVLGRVCQGIKINGAQWSYLSTEMSAGECFWSQEASSKQLIRVSWQRTIDTIDPEEDPNTQHLVSEASARIAYLYP